MQTPARCASPPGYRPQRRRRASLRALVMSAPRAVRMSCRRLSTTMLMLDAVIPCPSVCPPHKTPAVIDNMAMCSQLTCTMQVMPDDTARLAFRQCSLHTQHAFRHECPGYLGCGQASAAPRRASSASRTRRTPRPPVPCRCAPAACRPATRRRCCLRGIGYRVMKRSRRQMALRWQKRCFSHLDEQDRQGEDANRTTTLVKPDFCRPEHTTRNCHSFDRRL